MALDLVVGVYGFFEGPEVREELDAQLAAVNAALSAAGFPEHREPTDPAPTAPWECPVGYRELNGLRRLAAHLGSGATPPPPLEEGEEAGDDPVLCAWYAQALADRPFEHLIQHGAEGWYVPVDFPIPLFGGNVEGQFVGSTQRLYADCLRLRDALGIPEGATVDDLSEWADEKEPRPWQRYEDESYTCLALLRACEVSLATYCAILF